MYSCRNTETKSLLSYIDLAEAKNKAPINENKKNIAMKKSN